MSKKKEISGLITGLVAIVAAGLFVILGFSFGGWNYAWTVFLAIPVTAIIGDIVMGNKDLSGAIVGIVALLAAGVYVLIGFASGMWSPSWIVFFAIPIAAILTDLVKKKDIYGSVVGLVAMLVTIVFLLMGFYLNNWYVGWVVFLLIPVTAIIGNIIKIYKRNDGEENKQG